MIKCNPEINFGQPALVGRRLTVFNIVTKLYYEKSLEEAISDYEISIQDARDAVQYCMHMKCEQDKDLQHYCDGCILRTIQEGWKFNKDEYKEVQYGENKYTLSKDGRSIFLGSLKELEDSEFGMVTWLIAEEVNKRF
jgi:uncharacterized protein (DUF433 family)